MDFNLPPIAGGVERTEPPSRGAPAPQAGFGAALDAAVNVSTLPASPPPAVLEDMHAAARVYQELRDQKRELHFEVSDGGVAVQVDVQLTVGVPVPDPVRPVNGQGGLAHPAHAADRGDDHRFAALAVRGRQ